MLNIVELFDMFCIFLWYVVLEARFEKRQQKRKVKKANVFFKIGFL